MSRSVNLSLSAGLAGLVLAASVSAAEPLNAAQLKATFAGKTVEATHMLKGINQTTYFSPDGKLVQANDKGAVQKGTWRVEAAGTQCIQWEGEKETCSQVAPQGNGKYERLVNGKAVVAINKIVDGNPKNLKP